MFLFLTVLQAIVAAGLVAVVLMQRSEGGGLGIGGNPNGALGARGAADFLTRATKWLAIAFVALSIALAAVAVGDTSTGDITTTLDRDVAGPSTDDILGGSTETEATDENPLAAPEEPTNEDPLGQ